MLSRVAENLYWMSRYVERAENVARLLDDGFQFELDAGLTAGTAGPGVLDSLLTILACRDEFRAWREADGLSEPGPTTTAVAVPLREAVLEFLTFERRGAHSILAMLALARENARAAQETLSADAWRHVNRLYLSLGSPRARRRFRASPFRFYDGVKRACVLFAG